MTKKDQFWDLIETSSFHVDIKGIEDNIQHTSRQQPTTTTTTTTTTITTTTTTTTTTVVVVVVVVVVFQDVWSVIPFRKHNSSGKTSSSIYF